MKSPEYIVNKIRQNYFICGCNPLCTDESLVVVYHHIINAYLKMCRTNHKNHYVTYKSVALNDFTEDYLIVNHIHST